MKKFLIFILSVSFIITGMFTGCATLPEDAVSLFVVRTTAKEIGCEVSGMAPVIDTTLRNVYTLANEGRLTEDAVDQLANILNKHMKARKTTMDSFMEMIVLVGGIADPSGDGGLSVLRMNNIESKYMQAIAGGYVRGFDLCVNGSNDIR